MGEETIQKQYGFDKDADFESAFSKVSLESILFYVVATCIWTLEKLFDTHRQEVESIINELKPHSRRWYVSKAKAFMPGKALIPDTDEYDTAGMSDEAIAVMRIIKYAAVVEAGSAVYVKIAGEAAGEPASIEEQAYEGFKEYIREVKDAGVVVEIINEPAEHFRIDITIYYDPMVLDNAGVAFADGAAPVQDKIKEFIKNLPFNGEYRNVALVDALQRIEGVVIPELRLAETSRDGQIWQAVEAKAIPYPGYYKIYQESDLKTTFTPYETVSNQV
jgi:hypothetical protein